MQGATFYDLEALLLQKEISLIGELKVVVGTRAYQYNRDITRYKERITSEHLSAAHEFALMTKSADMPVSKRLTGVCGRNCQQCNNFNKSCKGAGFHCWSGAYCEVFNCCVIRKSYQTCEDCDKRLNCCKIGDSKRFS
jgi:hypothetical protein